MARATFGDTVADFLFTSTTANLARLISGTITFWSAKTGGTQYTDLLLNAVPVTSIPTGDDGQIPAFSGPDSIYEMWADGGGAHRVLMQTNIIGGANNATTAGFVTASGATRDALVASGVAALGLQAGVDPTGVSECAAAIQTALDSFATLGVKATAQGTFKIASTVTIKSDADLSAATFNYTGTSGTAVRIGTTTSGSFISEIRVNAPKIIATAKTVTGWAQVSGTIGLELSNLYASTVAVPLVRSFETGLRNYGKGKGNVHNTVLIGHLDNNKINQMVTADATGWSNQNLYLGGQFSHNSGEGTNVAGTRHIELGVCSNPVNTNMWINSSVEGDTAEFHAIIAGSYNVINHGRWEATTPKVKWATDAAENDIEGGYQSALITETFAGSGAANNISAPNRATRAGSGSTKGVMVYENQSSSANPAVVVMEAGARNAGSNPATAYAVQMGAQTMKMKRAADTNDRVMFDYVNGRVYFGDATGAIAMYLAAVSTSGVAFVGANLYFSADNAQDIGLAASLRPRYIRAGTAVVTGAAVTGSRPSASTAGVGAMFYDTTLSKPIWSNGTVWKDATGTTV